MFASDVRYQSLATLCGNILTVGYGGICGWPSASFLVLLSADTPLASGPLTIEEASWVGALMALGGMGGNTFFGWLSGHLGRKVPLMLTAVVQAISFLLIIFATNPIYLYISRFLSGMSGGAAFVLLPTFVTEISDDKVRGTLGSLLVFSCNIGILLAFVVGNYCSYITSPIVLFCIPCLFLVTFIFFPETPAYLMKCGKETEAEKSIRFYRNIRTDSVYGNTVVKVELDRLKQIYQSETDDSSSWTWEDINNPVARRALTIGMGLMFLNQLCGCFAMINYTATIFKQSGSDLSPNMAAIVVGIIQLIGSYFSTLFVERAGRKFLLSFSAFTTGLGLACLGTYTYLQSMGFNMSAFGWIPVVTFSVVIFVASLGVLTLPFLVISEIMPEKIRAFGTSSCTFLLWLLAFIMIKFFPLLTQLMGMHGSMFLFTFFSWSGALFVLALLPETKGRSIEEIMVLLGGKS